MGDAADDAYEAATREPDEDDRECFTCPDGVPAILNEEWVCPECDAIWGHDEAPTQGPRP